MNTYRVWMCDGYAGLYNAETEAEAKALAVKWAKESVEGAAMSPGDKRLAVTVETVEKVSQ